MPARRQCSSENEGFREFLTSVTRPMISSRTIMGQQTIRANLPSSESSPLKRASVSRLSTWSNRPVAQDPAGYRLVDQKRNSPGRGVGTAYHRRQFIFSGFRDQTDNPLVGVGGSNQIAENERHHVVTFTYLTDPGQKGINKSQLIQGDLQTCNVES